MAVFGFPNPVNEKAARTVAVGVVAMGLLFVITGWGWVLIPLTYGFWARVLSGPTLSPLGQLATRIVAPRLGEPKLVPGPPKRFAQAVGGHGQAQERQRVERMHRRHGKRNAFALRQPLRLPVHPFALAW